MTAQAADATGDGPASANPSAGSKDRRGYWLKRQRMMYYRYIVALGRALAWDARSMIDVGSHTTSIIEEFDWIADRAALDLRRPYSSRNVRAIHADFLTFDPDRHYDFAVCLQVLEHVPDAADFARKLLEIADRVLVSVPYKWPKGSHRGHCHDPVDEVKLAGWFGRDPDYRVLVEEPLQKRTGRRLIAYFHPPGDKLDLSEARKRLRTPSKAG